MAVNFLSAVVLCILPFAASGESQDLALSRSEVVAQALRVSPSIKAAQLKVAEARSHVAEVTAQRRFQLTLSGSVSTSYGQIAEPPSLQGYNSAEGTLSAPLPNLRKADAQIDQATAAYQVAQVGLRRAQLDIEFRANQGYLEFERALDSQAIAQANLDQSTRQVDDTKKRIQAGDVPAADLLKAQVPLAQNRAALTRAKNALASAQETLNDLLQRDLRFPITLSAEAPAGPTSVDTEKAIGFAILHSPDVLEADASLRGAEAALRAAKRSRDTDLSFQLSHSRTSDPTAYSYVTSLSLNFSLPIIDGGTSKAQISQAQSQVDQAKITVKLAQQQLRIAVNHAVLEVTGDEANVAATAETVDIAKQSVAKANQSYAAGLSTTRDVLDAQLVYSQAVSELNSAKYDLAIARAKLTQLLGGPYRE